jgi:hypothetical protein
MGKLGCLFWPSAKTKTAVVVPEKPLSNQVERQRRPTLAPFIISKDLTKPMSKSASEEFTEQDSEPQQLAETLLSIAQQVWQCYCSLSREEQDSFQAAHPQLFVDTEDEDLCETFIYNLADDPGLCLRLADSIIKTAAKIDSNFKAEAAALGY